MKSTKPTRTSLIYSHTDTLTRCVRAPRDADASDSFGRLCARLSVRERFALSERHVVLVHGISARHLTSQPVNLANLPVAMKLSSSDIE